ncbi:predicted protein [Enterococcus gallinarum EG2]|nr:predicted protein [Enterococcus gallinarum EG2]
MMQFALIQQECPLQKSLQRFSKSLIKKWNNQPLALVDLKKQNRTILMRNFIKYRNFRVEILFELWGFLGRRGYFFLYETVILKQNSEGNVF